jgi:hypothetical protein
MTHRPRRLFLLVVLVLTVLGFAATPAGAHTGTQAYLYLDITDDELGGRVEVPLDDVRAHFDVKLDGSTDDELIAGLEEIRSELTAYLDEHLSIGAGGRPFALEYTDIEVLQVEAQYGVVRFEATVPDGAVPRRLEVRFDPFFDDIPDRDGLLLIGNDWKSGIIDNGEESLLRFHSGERSQIVDLGSASQLKNFTASLELGVDHIRTGPDHILFVLALLLPSVLIFTTAWNPVDGFLSSLWRILKVVSMFTLAHSITFVAAGLDLLPLPSSKLVESIIALSIAATALHNLRPVFRNREWLIAFGFGLFHGMGFAGLVSGLDVSQTTKLVSLLGRNVGIELGQAVVVLLLFPGLYLLRRTSWYTTFFTVASIGLAIVALGWMIERLFEKDLRIGKAVDPIVEFPRSILWAVLFAAVAGALNLRERRRGSLRATVDPSSVTEEPELVLSGSSGAPR